MMSVTELVMAIIIFVGMCAGVTYWTVGAGGTAEEVTGIGNQTMGVLSGQVQGLQRSLESPEISKLEWTDVPMELISGAYTGAKLLFGFPSTVSTMMNEVSNKSDFAAAVMKAEPTGIGLWNIIFVAVSALIAFILLSAIFKKDF